MEEVKRREPVREVKRERRQEWDRKRNLRWRGRLRERATET